MLETSTQWLPVLQRQRDSAWRRQETIWRSGDARPPCLHLHPKHWNNRCYGLMGPGRDERCVDVSFYLSRSEANIVSRTTGTPCSTRRLRGCNCPLSERVREGHGGGSSRFYMAISRTSVGSMQTMYSIVAAGDMVRFYTMNSQNPGNTLAPFTGGRPPRLLSFTLNRFN